MKYISAQEAAKEVKSGDRIYVHAAAATPNVLTKAISDRAEELRGVEFCHMHTEGDAPYANPALADSFHVNSFFIGKNVRHTLAAGNGSYTPIFLSEIPRLFRKGALKVDVVLIQVSPPDEHGFCSLGVSVEAVVAAMEQARVIIAQINSFMPRTFGDSIIHQSKINFAVEHNVPIYASKVLPISDKEAVIGQYVASLIEDESTLQMGIGSIPNAVLAQLQHHKNLGLHTEMFSDGVIDLIQSGVIDCTKKKIAKGRAMATFLLGSERLYQFVDNNPFFLLKESSYVNDTAVIRQNPKVVAINSALEVDVTGQVCADSLGAKMYSGVGGQMDFVRGASLSSGGKAIIALASTSNQGHNRIVPFLKQGAGVVTTRAHIQYVVTEFGIADLYGKTLKQRVEAMANIAHPDFREAILKEYTDSIK
ncbi:MAG: 4-hydroxybutyrate CoA-transferase [Flavobacteriaceae bacterium]|jgi:acyl-CoA hydrolase|nr:4-hydroxybutyrate CoA-transferase [Flavobacteriaceae bacterium]